VQFKRAGETTGSTEVYARLRFQHIRVGDQVAVIQVGKHPFVVGVVQRAAYGTPTYTLNSIAGTGATMSIAGSDYSGVITVNSGSASLSAGQLFDFTFVNAWASTEYTVVLQPASNAAGDLQARFNITSRTTTKWTLNLRTALTASSTYIWHYQIRPYEP
jgi:hypothetical protein